VNHSFATWNLTHLTAGVRVGEPERAWTLGFGYAWGDDRRTNLIDLSDRGPLPGIDETPSMAEMYFARWKIIFGFELGTYFSVAMVALAGGAILYDTSNVLRRYPEDRYVAAALALFASVALMFWYVLRLFMAGRD
jgi:hypothetical protein